jgi:hypothetical protein
MTRHRDLVVCLVVSLCEDCGILCEDYRFSLIYVLVVSKLYVLLYIFSCMTYFEDSLSREAAKTWVIYI